MKRFQYSVLNGFVYKAALQKITKFCLAQNISKKLYDSKITRNSEFLGDIV